MEKRNYTRILFPSIREMLSTAVAEAGTRDAYRFKNKEGDIVNVTYDSFNNRTENLGAALTARGLGSASIACVGDNSYNWITAYLTVLKGAGTFVPIDKELPTAEMLHILNESDSTAVFYDARFEDWMHEHRAEMPAITCFIGFDRAENDGEFLSLSALIEEGRQLSRADYDALRRPVGNTALLVYTSGTTGVAKGVMLTEQNLLASVHYGEQVSTIREVGLSVLPYHHTYEAVCDLLVGIYFHTTLCINDSIKNVSKNMKLFRPEYIYLVPAFGEAFYNNIMRTIKKQGKEKTFAKAVRTSNALRKVGIDMRRTFFKEIHENFGGRLEKIVCGGAAIRPEIGKFFDDIGILFTGGYGITECSPLVCVNGDDSDSAVTAGHRLACVEWRIDEPNEEGIGEICVKGDIVMKGYYKNPEKTAEALRDGWFYTGDYGKLTPNDELIITGRKKNIIVLNNGKNVYPEELERYIQQIPYITEVVVKGIKNEHNQDIGLLAEVYMAEEKPEESQITRDIQDALHDLPSYKHISKVVIRSEPFDKTTTNKIKR